MLTQKYLKGLTGTTGQILVDCGTARDNCTRTAERAGWRVRVEELPGGVFRLLLEK